MACIGVNRPESVLWCWRILEAGKTWRPHLSWSLGILLRGTAGTAGMLVVAGRPDGLKSENAQAIRGAQQQNKEAQGKARQDESIRCEMATKAMCSVNLGGTSGDTWEKCRVATSVWGMPGKLRSCRLKSGFRLVLAVPALKGRAAPAR